MVKVLVTFTAQCGDCFKQLSQHGYGIWQVDQN